MDPQREHLIRVGSVSRSWDRRCRVLDFEGRLLGTAISNSDLYLTTGKEAHNSIEGRKGCQKKVQKLKCRVHLTLAS